MFHLAKVLIDGPSELVFDYGIPERLAGSLVPGARVRVSLRGRKATGTVTAVVPRPAEMDFEVKDVDSVIEGQPLVTPKLMELARWVADYYCAPLETVMRSLLPEQVRAENTAHKSRKVVSRGREPMEGELDALEKKAKRQYEVLREVRTADEPVKLSELPAASVKALEKAGLVRIEDLREERDPHAETEFIPSLPLVLNPAQQAALDAVVSAISEPEKAKPLLLLGVTGSGKTEVYLQAVQHALDQGKTALVLVPEISLTPQTVDRFKSRFASLQKEIAVLHSHLSTGERHDEWHKAARREARIVIGARSAIFAPLERLGVIIVDEEHENSYKQDTVPRYHARDLAVLRGHLEKCAVLLGSATPSLETWQNVQKGKYGVIQLKERIDNVQLPLVRVVDMRTEKARDKSAPAIFSEQLRLAVDRRLAKGEQIILFLNRRGYSNSLQCQACGEAEGCPHCSVSLVFHQAAERLICHICGFQSLVPRKCRKCGDPSIRFAGFGTERVEEALKKIFPKARSARIDADTMQKKNLLRDTLSAFKAHKLDMLIGTQMIAKGLHFPNVTLVGVLNADLGLHIPDFRAGERTFQILTQVAGRAGRGDLAGEVMIQTFSPHHPAIQYARKTDFEGYAAQELEFRKALGFPPYGHLVLLTVRSEKENLGEFAIKTLHLRLAQGLPPGVTLGDPAPSPLIRAENYHRFQIMLKGRTTRLITNHLKATLARLPMKEVLLTIDVDPYSLS